MGVLCSGASVNQFVYLFIRRLAISFINFLKLEFEFFPPNFNLFFPSSFCFHFWFIWLRFWFREQKYTFSFLFSWSLAVAICALAINQIETILYWLMAIPFVDDLVVAVAVVLITNAKQMTALLNHFTFTVHHIQNPIENAPLFLQPVVVQRKILTFRWFVVTFFYVDLIWFLFGHSPTIQSYWPFRFYCISLRTLRTYTIITFVRSESTKCIAQSKQFEDSISFRYLLQSDLISILFLFTFCLCSHY